VRPVRHSLTCLDHGHARRFVAAIVVNCISDLQLVSDSESAISDLAAAEGCGELRPHAEAVLMKTAVQFVSRFRVPAACLLACGLAKRANVPMLTRTS
jgi:hypothetical protein